MFALGEQTVSSNIASILNATTPLFTLLIGVATHDAAPTGQMWLGVLVGLGGVALTALGGVLAKKKTAGITPLSLAASQLLLSVL